MSINDEPKRSTTPEAIDHHIGFVGGAAAVTKTTDTGPGVTVTYISTGIVDLKWFDSPGLFMGLQATFRATAPAAVKGYTLTYGDPTIGTDGSQTVRLNINNSSFALADLAAAQFAYITATFKRSGTGV